MMRRHSYIEYRGRRCLVVDGSIAVLIEELNHWAKNNCVDIGKNWLVSVSDKMLDEYKTMPPGLRDVELDEYIGSQEEHEWFETAIRSAENKALHEGNDVVADVCKKCLGILKSRHDSD